jgi:Tfp pilus assembly protein PilF
LHKSSKRQHQTSARLWQRAVLLAPRDADILTGYGTLLHRVMCKPEDAKALIMRALAVNPKHPCALLANALLLQSNRDYEEAERNFIDARKYLPNELSIITHYCNFLKKCSGKYKESEELFELGMTINPCDSDHLGAYAQFMFKVRGNTDRANNLFLKAIEADPIHWHNLSRYANMLKKTGENK